MFNFILASIYFVIVFVLIELISRKYKIQRELSRKTAHIIIGSSAAFLPYFLTFQQIIILSTFSLAMIALSRFFKIFQSVHDVERLSFGELFFPLGIILTAWIFPDIQTYQFGILVMALGDGLAGLIGSNFGKKKYQLVRYAHKSYLGSFVFFIVASAIGFAIFPSYSILFITLILTIVEAMSAKGIDNILLPTIGAMLFLLFKA